MNIDNTIVTNIIKTSNTGVGLNIDSATRRFFKIEPGDKVVMRIEKVERDGKVVLDLEEVRMARFELSQGFLGTINGVNDWYGGGKAPQIAA